MSSTKHLILILFFALIPFADLTDKPAKAVLTLDPPWAVIFTGDKITLKCAADDFWYFKWYQARKKDSLNKIRAEEYTINTAAVSHSGEYTCKGDHYLSESILSDPIHITVSDERVILQTPPQPVFEGDALTLRCRDRYNSDITRVVFYKDNKELQSQADTELSVARVSKSDEGSYKCRAWRWSAYLGDSAEVRVSVRERPQAVLTLEPAWTQIFKSESVTLRCEVQGDYTGWRLTWYKDGKKVSATQDYYSRIDDKYTISSATQYHSGEYTCQGERTGNPSYSKTSDALTLRVSKLFSTPTLTVLPGASVWEGEAVTLQCGAQINKQGTQLQYHYIKDNGNQRRAGSQDQHSIPAAELRDTGSYQCEVEAAGTGLKKKSGSVSLTVKELPQTTLTPEPPFPEIFIGETVTLRCGVKGGSAGWKYLWYKDSEDTPVLQTAAGDSYTITAAAISDQGQYCCRGQRGDQPLYSQRSDKVILTVSDTWVILQTPPQPVIEGDSLTLRCRVRTNYTFSRIVFFKDNEEIQSQNNTELSVDRVSKSDEGSYKCRAMWNSSTYSGDSAEVRVSVRGRFTRTSPLLCL
ncbi:Fc receptor-like protein 5 [Acipenser ruthenus]|uniref:Fc receptor-like protein 5 n=1 Tax=Acipenser ruthenus TaxID=7906 RepID=UPI0027403934|nr:Fc receptor-like protein 5 [Acipenser ruthenus]